MARSDLLLNLVRSGAKGDQVTFRKAIEALVADERSKQHHVLADRLAAHLVQNGNGTSAPLSGGIKNSQFTDLFYHIEPRRRLHDIILPSSVELACKELAEEQHRSDLLRAHNLEPRNRVLLAGPPGNGKTSLAEVLATELAVPLLVVRYEAIIASYLGETAIRISRLFDQVRTRRCVLFFDEFDVVGKERGDIHETGEIKRVVSSLLLQVDALPSYVVVVTATNHPELLDRAVWRRFQLRMELPSPTPKMIEEWFRRFEERLGEKLGVSLTILSKQLKGANFAEIEQFGQDIQRRYVLSLPQTNMPQIVKERLNQWDHRYSIASDKREKSNA